jgi:hypothetical protein
LGCPVRTPHTRDFLAVRGTRSLNLVNNLHQRSRAADAVALVVSLLVLAVGSAVLGSTVKMPGSLPTVAVMSTPTKSSSASGAVLASNETGSVQITMTVGHQVATATLDDTPAGHQLAAMLPLTMNLRDPFGQAKSGPLPHRIDGAATAADFHPLTGEIYYWPDGGDLAVFYDALGQAVPPPGLVHVGGVDSGLDAVASRGDVTVTIERAD